MLKATFKSKYYSKKGALVFVYRVGGTAKELTAYISAKAKELKIPEAEVTRDDDGITPLYHFAQNIELGRIGTPVKFLTINTFNGKINEDDTDLVMTEANEDRLMMRQEIAKVRAQRFFDRSARGQRTMAAAAPVVNNETTDDVTDELDEEISKMQTGGAKPEGALAGGEDEGKENLDDKE